MDLYKVLSNRIIDLYHIKDHDSVIYYDLDTHVLWQKCHVHKKNNDSTSKHWIIFYSLLLGYYWFQPSYSVNATIITDILIILLLNILITIWAYKFNKKHAQIQELVQATSDITKVVLLQKLPLIKGRFYRQAMWPFVSIFCGILGGGLFLRFHNLCFALIEVLGWMLICAFFTARHRFIQKWCIIQQIEQGTLPLTE
ncbi:MAG: hypothetical protein LBN26_09255 [Christensenellaceae bacterium]|jgi:hypothetical protein|nr:hypothetical protein [Christensenellaceae bacterium]